MMCRYQREICLPGSPYVVCPSLSLTARTTDLGARAADRVGWRPMTMTMTALSQGVCPALGCLGAPDSDVLAPGLDAGAGGAKERDREPDAGHGVAIHEEQDRCRQ